MVMIFLRVTWDSPFQEAESKITKSRLQLKAKDAKFSNLKKTMNESRASGSSHGTGKHEPRSGDSANVKSKLLFQQKKIEEKERTIEIQQQTLQDQETKFDKLREEFHSRHEELCQRLQQVSSNQGIDVTELTDNTPHVKDLYSAIMAKDQKIAELMSQVDESNFTLQNITQAFQKAEEERANISEKYEGNENLIAKQSSRVSDLEELVQSMSDGYENETNTIEELQRQVAKLEMKLRDKEETVAVKEDQILQLKRENNASLDDMQETSHQHDQLMRSLKRKLHEQDEVLAGKEKVVVLLQSELTDRSIELSGLQNTIQVLQESIRDNMKANNSTTATMYAEDRTNNNSDDDDEMVDLNKSSWDDGEGINFKNKYDHLLVQKDLQIAENAALKEQIQELEQKSYRLEVQLRELNQQFNDEASMWCEKEMAYEVKLTSYCSEDGSSTTEDTLRAQEDMEIRMKTILSQMNNQTKVLEDQTESLEKSEAEVKRLKQTVSSYKTNNNQLQAELKEQKQQFEASTDQLRKHMEATEERFNIQLREVERAKLLFQEYLDGQHAQVETLLIEEHFSREVDNLVSSGDCTQYWDQINHFKNQVNLLRSKSQERVEPGEELTPAISCLIDQAASRTMTLASTFDLSRMLIRYLRQERDQIRGESNDLSEQLREKRTIGEQSDGLRRDLNEREEKLKSQSELIEKLTAERLDVDEKLRKLDERFREFASDSKKLSLERESWIEEMKATHERDIAEAHRDRSDLEARLKAVTQQRAVVASERETMEEKLRTVEKDNDDVMWGMDERLSKLEVELDAKVGEHESMVNEMQGKHEEMVEGLICDLEAATNRFESEKDELLHRLKEATTHAEELKRDSDECTDQIKHLTAKNHEFEVRIEALTCSCLDRDQELKSAVEKRDAAEQVLAELRSHLADSSHEIGKLQANIQHKSEHLLEAQKERDALAKEAGELERRNDEITSGYWMESDSRMSDLLKQERDVAISRATDLQDAVDEHQSEVEKKLVDTEDKLKTAKLQLQDKMNANGFDNDLQMFQDPSLMKGDSQKQQTIQFLQSQLEELAREQEYQTSEHMTIVGRKNENIERLTEEKDDLSTSLERQLESLNEIAKRYDEKESDCHRLIRVVDDLQHKLEEAKALREDNFVTSQKYTARLRHAEDRINEFEDKLQESMEELMMTKDEKEKCEHKIPVLSRNLEETRAENLMLLDELKRLRTSVQFLQQELESASEGAEQMGKRHRDEVTQLKSLLRERDKAASTLSGDLCEREQTISSMNQTCIERTRQYEQQEVKLIERNNKVLELEGSMREYESELVALSQHSNGAMEKAQFRAQDLAEYVNKLEERVQSSDAQKAVVEKQVENLCEKLAMNDQQLADIRRSCEEKDADLRKQLFDSECSLDAQMRDLKELEEKKLYEVEEEKARSQELQVKLDCQALEVSRLTSYLEDQIYESNDHHRKERTRLEDHVKSLKCDLHDYEKTHDELKENLSISTQFTATLSSKVEELEKWEREYQEKNELCGNLQSSCDLLEERLQEASKRAREFEQRLSDVTSQLDEARVRVEEREARVKALFDELTRTNNEVRTLKDALCAESERQLNELNSMVEERLAERDNQIAATAERVNELCAVINMKDLNYLKVKEELQQVKRSSQDAIEAKSNELEHFQAANQHLHEEFDALEAESSRTETSLQKVVEELKSKVEAMSSNAEETSLNTSRLDEELNRTLHELNETRDNGERALQEKVATYEAQTAKRKKIMKALQIRFREEKERLESELKSMREQRGGERDAELSALQRKVEESELLSASLRDQLASLITSSQEELTIRDSMITQLQSQITHLTQHIDDVTTAARDSSSAADEDHRRRVAELQEENSTVCRQLADARDESSRLRRQHDVIKCELEQLRKENDASSVVVENLQRKSSEAEAAEVTSLRSQLASLEAEKSASILSLRDEIESLEEARNRVESLQRQLNDQNDEKFAEEKKHFTESQRKLKAALVSRKSLIGKMKELETKSKEKEDAASASLALLHHQVAELEASMRTEAESGGERRKENSCLNEKNNELIAQISKLEEDRTASASAHENAMENLEKELETLRQSVVELGEERRKLLEEKATSEDEFRNQMQVFREENEVNKLNHINFVSDAEKESCMLKEEISNLLESREKNQQLEDELNEKIATLEQQKIQLESELNTRKEDFESMKYQFDETRTDLNEQVANLSKDLHESQESLERQKNQLESGLNAQKENYEESCLNEKNNELIAQISKLEEDRTASASAHENAMENLEKELETLRESSEKREAAEGRLNEALQVNDELSTRVESLQEEKMRVDAVLKCAEVKQSELQSQLSSTTQLLDDAVRNAAGLQNDVNNLNERMAALQQTIANSSVEEEKLQKSSSARQSTITTLQRKLKAALVSRQELLKANSQLEADLKLSKTETELAHSEVSSLQEVADNRNAALQQHNLELTRSCEEKSALKTQMDELEATMGVCREESGQVEEELRRTRSQVKTLQEEVTTLETCNNDLNDTTSALEVGKSKLERSLADKTEMLRSAQKCIRKLEKSGSPPPSPEGAVEVEKLKKHNEELTRTMNENEEKLEALSLQLEDSRAECEKVESQLDTLRHQTTVMTSPPPPPPSEPIDPASSRVECEDIEVQTNNDDDDELEVQIKKARLQLIEETLTQLKSTQPELWEQEPGIKKLIDRMELAMSQSTKRQKELNKKEKQLTEATANLTALQVKVSKVEDENARLCEDNAVLPDLRKEVDESRIRVAAVLRDCDHLNTALQSEKDSYDQVHRRLERDNHMLREKMNHRLVAEQELNDQLNELKLKVADLEREKHDLVQERTGLLSSKDRIVEIESAKEEVEMKLKTMQDGNNDLKLQVERVEGHLVEKSNEICETERKLEESRVS